MTTTQDQASATSDAAETPAPPTSEIIPTAGDAEVVAVAEPEEETADEEVVEDSASEEAAIEVDIQVGMDVTWVDADGTQCEGSVVDVTGLAAAPPTVSVAMMDDPEMVVEVPVDSLVIEEPAEEAVETPWAVAEGHEGCTGEDGTYGVVNTETGDLDSCHPDGRSAQARADELNGVEAETEDEPADAGEEISFDEGTEGTPAEELATGGFVDGKNLFRVDSNTLATLSVSPLEGLVRQTNEALAQPAPPKKASVPKGMTKLERAARLAEEVRQTLDLLGEVSPEIADAAPTSPTIPARDFGVVDSHAPSWFIDHAQAPTTAHNHFNFTASSEEIAKEITSTMTTGGIIPSAEKIAVVGEDKPEVVIPLPEHHETLTSRNFHDTVDAVAAINGLDLTDVDGEGAVELLRELARIIEEATAVETVEAPVESDETVETSVESDEATELAEVVEEAPEEVPGETIDAPTEAEVEEDWDWEAVITVEGIASGDGRMIAEGALTCRELPLPLMSQTINASGHDGAVIAGSCHKIERDGSEIWGYGYFDQGEAGQELKRLVTDKTMRGISADIDSVVVEFVAEDGTPVSFDEVMFEGVVALEVLVEGRIMGMTACAFPAFQEAFITVIPKGEPDAALVASGQMYEGDVWRVYTPVGMWTVGQRPNVEALVASATAGEEPVEIPVNPPGEWFASGEMETPQPLIVYPDGRIYGLVAQWGTCHIGFSDRCVEVPHTKTNYSYFRNKNVLTAEGDLVATGPIFINAVHPKLKLIASDTQAHYAHTGCAVADVALYENEFGIVAAGAVRPSATPEQVRILRGSDVSPDWREINENLEAVGLLCVNVSGFLVEGALVASAGALISRPQGLYDSRTGRVTALVAAGMVHRHNVERSDFISYIGELRDQVESLAETMDRLVLTPERERERQARVAAVRQRLSDLSEADEAEAARKARLQEVRARLDAHTTTARKARLDQYRARLGIKTCGCDSAGETCSCEIGS